MVHSGFTFISLFKKERKTNGMHEVSYSYKCEYHVSKCLSLIKVDHSIPFISLVNGSITL